MSRMTSTGSAAWPGANVLAVLDAADMTVRNLAKVTLQTSYPVAR